MPAAIVASLLLVAVPAAGGGTPHRKGEKQKSARPFFDARARGESSRASAGQANLRSSLGLQGIVDVDRLTGTPRVVARLDGFLTGPSRGDAKDVALDYVRAHPEVFRLGAADLAGLRIARDYTDAHGTRHLVWAQTYRGIAAFDNDLRANVTADGRLINLLGSPVPGLSGATVPTLDAGRALGAAFRNVGRQARVPRVLAREKGGNRTTRFAGGHRANLVFLTTGRGVRLAWRVTAHAADQVYDSVVDASTGAVLRRAPKVDDANATVWDYRPTSAPGGGASNRPLPAGWLAPGAQKLEGPNAHVFSDFDDDDRVDLGGFAGSEEVQPTSTDTWNHAFTAVTRPPAAGFCAPDYASVCSWDSYDDVAPPGWYANRRQNATQVFYFVNTFHDQLRDDPGIAFDALSGNFEGQDKVVAHADDGADTGDSGFLGDHMPDENHVNNANMFTPPDGESPRMQMYLFTTLTGSYASDPTPDVNGGDDASVVYHEYTHGLSNRLITYSDGWGALDAPQSSAMGEGWSDWYAMDYLADQGFAPDTAADGEVVLDAYVANAEHVVRSEGLDCPVGSPDPECPGAGTAGPGGYTYGDYGKVYSGPESHADGEIWAQTLWDLRRAVGVAAARALVTGGMRLSPANPSFLDMRNAILQADETYLVGANTAAIWQVFADRGMGFFSATDDANDASPIEDFSLPPDPSLGVGTVNGIVKDAETGKPLAGARVEIVGHGSGPGMLAAVSNATGSYAITGVPVGVYPKVQVVKKAYDRAAGANVSVAQNTATRLDLRPRRDWSAKAGGGRVWSFSGRDYSADGCGPGGAIDQSPMTGWSSDTGAARSLVVRLPSFVDVSAVAVDPGATCGDPPGAALKGYRIQVSQTNGSWTTVKSGTFSPADGGSLKVFSIATRKGMRFVRITMLSAQDGLSPYVDLSEISVYGKQRPSCLGLPATKVGTNGRNRINGTRRADVIVGNGGNDRINGRGGNDVICGGAGNDTLIGGGGVDKFDGGGGRDTIYSRDGRRERTVKGGSGVDRARRDASDRVRSVERFF